MSPTAHNTSAPSVEFTPHPAAGRVLTDGALALVADLTREFRPRIDAALAAREDRRRRWAAGETIDFLPDTQAVRDGHWSIDPVPADIQRRHVEITGPVDRKMIINALNSGADVFMADFEDATSPTWANIVDGQLNLHDAVRRTIAHRDPETGKQYRLADRTAVLFVRPRGLHLPERHLTIDGRAVPGCLFDFGIYAFHNARELVDRGSAPYLYLPKLESHVEARIWNDVICFVQDRLSIRRGTVKATVLIETLPAAFEMDEILYELRTHSAGLNCGRWDYIFSWIKTRRHDRTAVLPDRSQVTMTQPSMRAYTQLAIRTCHRRGAHAMGGMSAFIPVKNDPDANERAFAKVREDKLREVTDGHDGTWVAHPALVPLARDVFAAAIPGPHQIERRRDDVRVSRDDLLRTPAGTRTEDGLRLNVRVGIRYLDAWLRGTGAVPLFNLMEDAATAEISRTQLWQWQRWGAELDDGRRVTRELVDAVIDDELRTIVAETGPDRFDESRFEDAASLFRRLATADRLEEFLTLPAYDMLDSDPVPDDARRATPPITR